MFLIASLVLWTLSVRLTLNVKSPLAGAFFLLCFCDCSEGRLVSSDLVLENWFEAHLLRGIKLALEARDLQFDSVENFGFVEFDFNGHYLAPNERK